MSKQVLAFLMLCWTISACDTERILPQSSGAPGELVIVMPLDQWEGEMGKAVRSMFGQAIDGLPQREARFTMLNYSPSKFPDLLRTHRNILFAEVGSAHEKAVTRKVYEKWAKRQQFIQMVAPNSSDWLVHFNAQGEKVIELFEQAERRRLQVAQRKRANKNHSQMLSDEFGIKMNIPADFEIAKNLEDFKHFRRDRVISSKSKQGEGFSQLGHHVIDGIFVYKYPYTSDSTFTRPALMNMRDTLLKYNVPGQVEGSYMDTQRFFEDLDLRPSLQAVELDSSFATQMRGLWGMVHAKMGGPFVSVSFVGPSGKEVIAVEGYCFAPQFDKREFLRYVDAIVYSTKMVD